MLGNDHFKPFPNIAKLLYQKNSAHSKSPGKYRDFVYSLKLPHDIPCGSFNIFIDKIIFLILIFRLMNDIFQHLCSLSKLISYVSYQPS